MRCSWCEPLLDDYLEATLSPRQMREVAEHIDSCPSCGTFLQELRVVDALLWTVRPPGSIGSDFTQTVVSATRGAHPQRVNRLPLWAPLLAYLALAWVAVGFAATRAADLRTLLAGTLFSSERGLAAISAALRAVAPATTPAAVTVAIVLAVDALVLCAMLYGYRRLRPRLALYLGKGTRS